MALDQNRINKMRDSLGAASELVDNDQYLPMFRNRQINYPELFEFSTELAKRKDNPARYFAKLWGAKTLAKTLDWLQKLVNIAKSKAAELVRNMAKQREDQRAEKEMNREGRRRLERMKKKMLQQAAAHPMRT